MLYLTWLFAALHYSALAIGMGSVFMRGIYMKRLEASPSNKDIIQQLFIADNLWGVAAFLWISTGLMRAFGGLEKGTDWYLQNKMFHLKMGLFIIVFLLELLPMIALVRWRIAFHKKQPLQGLKNLGRYRILNQIELALIFILIFAATAMARGVGY